MCGMWQWDGPPTVYRIYGSVTTLLFYILYPLGLFVQVFFAANIYESIQIACIFFTSLCGFKLWLVMRQRRLIVQTFQILNDLDGQILTRQHYSTIVTGVDRAKLVNLFGCFINGTATCWVYLVKLLENDRTLIWPFFVPFEYRENAMVFHVVLFYQFLGTVWVAFVHSSVDAIGGSMYSVLGAHMNVLEMRMSRLGVDDDDDTDDVDDEISTKPKRLILDKKRKIELQKMQNYLELIKCVETHKLCLK